jgi:asparagine N-glycosylation enzyme membrane subunit Stt3
MVATFAIAAIAIYPSAIRALAVASAPTGGPTAAWLQALDWMRANTPEPFGSPDKYFERYRSRADAPPAQYGVMAWWDYGWWVAQIARRPPSTNPTQVAVKEAARFYLSTDERDALAILGERSVRYVIADRSMPMSAATAGRPMASQLEVMARWAEWDASRYYDLYFERGQPVFIYTPDYYRTMAIRLFAYGGAKYLPSKSTWAIAAAPRNEITDSRLFDSYDEAAVFVAANPRTWRLVGRHPLLSPVPIDPLMHLVREFSSSPGVDGPIGRIADVSVFRVK